MRHLFFAQFIILYIISTGLAGCGYKGPPIPPIPACKPPTTPKGPPTPPIPCKPPTTPLEEAKV